MASCCRPRDRRRINCRPLSSFGDETISIDLLDSALEDESLVAI